MKIINKSNLDKKALEIRIENVIAINGSKKCIYCDIEMDLIINNINYTFICPKCGKENL